MDTNLFDKALEYLTKHVDSELQIQTLRCFLFVAHRGSCSQQDVEKGLGLTNASVSRNISYWTERRFDRKPGKNMIMRVEDDYDRRYRVLTLTTKGRELMKALKENL